MNMCVPVYISFISKVRRIYHCNRCYRSYTTQSLSFFTPSTIALKQTRYREKQDSSQQTLKQSEWFKSVNTDNRTYHQCWIRLFQSTASCLLADGISKPSEISEAEYDTYVEETLDSLTDFFEDLPENGPCNKDYDCSYASGVLTINIGGSGGTYVINKQTPNKQIWLSSPVSGPKRYDYLGGQWVYLRDGKGLHRLLEEEISKLIGIKIDLKKCRYYS